RVGGPRVDAGERDRDRRADVAPVVRRRQRLRRRLRDRRLPVHPRRPGPAPQRASLQEGGMSAAAAEAKALRSGQEGVAARIGRVFTRAPVHIFLVFIGALWLVPTFGLFLTSLMPADMVDTTGWWKLISQPHLATWANYSSMWHDSGIPSTLWTTAQIAIGG